MAEFIDNLLVVVIILLIILLIWSKVMNQTMLETIKEIKEILAGMAGAKDGD